MKAPLFLKNWLFGFVFLLSIFLVGPLVFIQDGYFLGIDVVASKAFKAAAFSGIAAGVVFFRDWRTGRGG